MKIDRDSLSEIGTTVVRNKSRSLLTAFGVFWGIFMLVVMLGGGQGLQDKLSQNFKGFATIFWCIMLCCLAVKQLS